MTQRSVVVKLSAQVGDYVSGFDKAASSTDKLAQSQDKTSQSTQQVEQATKRTSAQLQDQAAAAQKAASALGLQYNASGQLTDANGKVLSSSQAAAQGMDKFSDAVYLTADATEEAGQNAAGAVSGLDRLAQSAKDNQQAWQQAGQALLGFGVGMVAALGATAKASMDWQSAWAGVTKTVDGSPEQMRELEAGLRGLAKTLPITHTEIAGVAEAAGQLGVARKDVLGFTKTMVDLGVSTNLTAEDAATQIAQISNVMGTMSRDGAVGVARFGSALVALGNDGASTEAEILSMAQRIAGAGATVGATEVDVLALSNTLASMGVQAELGGGVATRVLVKMYSAVQEGGASLESFAKVAGVSMADFSKAFEDSPVKAMDMVAQGLARVKAEGGNVVQAMSDLGISGTQEVQVMLALANSGTLLADSLELGSKAWQENTALIDEATKRYDTAESRVTIAWNNIKDAAISAGAVLLPVISNIADGVSNLASFFGGLPAPVQGALTVLAGLAGVAALAAGAFLTLFPRVMDTISAFKTLGVTGGDAGGKLKTLGKALGIASVALAAAGALKAMHNAMQPAVATTQDMTQALLKLKNTGATNAINDVFANIDPGSGGAVLKDINNIGDALARLQSNSFKDNIGQWANDAMGVNNDFTKLEETLTNLDQSMGGMVAAGNFDAAAEGFRSVAESAKAQGIELETVGTYFPTYLASLQELASAQGVTVSETELLNWAMGEVPQSMLDAAGAAGEAGMSTEELAAAQEAAAAASEEFADAMAEIGLTTDGTIASLDKYTDALLAAGLSTMSSREAAFNWEASLRDVGAAIDGVLAGQGELGPAINATATDFDTMTDSGKAANEVFQGIIREGLGVASTFSKDVSKSAADVNQQLGATYQAGLEAARGLGLGEEAAVALTREALKIPKDVSIETWMSEQALIMSGNTGDSVNAIPDSVRIDSSMSTAAFEVAGMTKKAADDIPNKETIDSWMSDAAFVEAVKTRAAAEGIPPDVAIDSFMESAARNEADSTTAQVLKIPKGTSISSFMEAYARIEADNTARSIAGIERNVNVSVNIGVVGAAAAQAALGGIAGAAAAAAAAAGGASGGRVDDIMGFFAGGRVPGQRSANVAKDNTFGITRGEIIGLQGTEWVINPNSSDEYDKELAAINAGSFPKGVLDGALATGAGREWQLPSVSATGGGTQVIEKHYHTHVSSAPGMEQSYAQTIADKATQRQQDIQLAYAID